LESGGHFDSSRAELFEALGHPTRVRILRTLEGKPMGFAELKREVGIESSGHLQFHLGKLAGLVTTNAEGSYTLTDDGREAIRVLKAIPTTSEQVPLVSKVPKIRYNWLIPILAILLIAIVILAGLAIYQQEQIATTNRDLSSATVSLGGTRYYFETLPVLLPPNGTSFRFHGVTFTLLEVPTLYLSTESIDNYTGSYVVQLVRLTNGTFLNLTGKTVVETQLGFCDTANATTGFNEVLNFSSGVHFLYCEPGVGMSITYPDGSQTVYPGFNLTARHQNAYGTIATPVYVLTYTILPSPVSPWFTQHDGVTAGFSRNATSPITLYVSVPS